MNFVALRSLTEDWNEHLGPNFSTTFADRLIAHSRMNNLIPGIVSPTDFPADAVCRTGPLVLALYLDLRVSRGPTLSLQKNHVV